MGGDAGGAAVDGGDGDAAGGAANWGRAAYFWEKADALLAAEEAAVAAAEAAGGDDAGASSMRSHEFGRIERYEVQAELAALYETGGAGLPADRPRAAELYGAAAERAMAAFKSKRGMQLMEKAEECGGE